MESILKERYALDALDEFEGELEEELEDLPF